jgi:hypothetical protein
VIARTGFYIKVEVRSSKGIPLVIVVIIVSITVTALKIGDVLTYSLVPFFLYIVRRLIPRFTAYKALFALAVLIIRGVISSVRGAVLLVGIE